MQCNILCQFGHKGLTLKSEKIVSYITRADCTQFKTIWWQIRMPALASWVELSCQDAATCNACIALLGCTCI